MEQEHRRPNRSLWSKIWQDDRGHIVIWQMPNALLIGWAVLSVGSIVANGRLADIFSWLSSAALIMWCLMEIFKGVNYLRRGLGLVVLVFAVMVLAKSL